MAGIFKAFFVGVQACYQDHYRVLLWMTMDGMICIMFAEFKCNTFRLDLVYNPGTRRK